MRRSHPRHLSDDGLARSSSVKGLWSERELCRGVFSFRARRRQSLSSTVTTALRLLGLNGGSRKPGSHLAWRRVLNATQPQLLGSDLP
jgi:hypothetical protein